MMKDTAATRGNWLYTELLEMPADEALALLTRVVKERQVGTATLRNLLRGETPVVSVSWALKPNGMGPDEFDIVAHIGAQQVCFIRECNLPRYGKYMMKLDCHAGPLFGNDKEKLKRSAERKLKRYVESLLTAPPTLTRSRTHHDLSRQKRKADNPRKVA